MDWAALTEVVCPASMSIRKWTYYLEDEDIALEVTMFTDRNSSKRTP